MFTDIIVYIGLYYFWQPKMFRFFSIRTNECNNCFVQRSSIEITSSSFIRKCYSYKLKWMSWQVYFKDESKKGVNGKMKKKFNIFLLFYFVNWKHLFFGKLFSLLRIMLTFIFIFNQYSQSLYPLATTKKSLIRSLNYRSKSSQWSKHC